MLRFNNINNFIIYLRNRRLYKWKYTIINHFYIKQCFKEFIKVPLWVVNKINLSYNK